MLSYRYNTHFAVEMCDSRRQHVSRAMYAISRSEERGGVLGIAPKTPVALRIIVNDNRKKGLRMDQLCKTQYKLLKYHDIIYIYYVKIIENISTII